MTFLLSVFVAFSLFQSDAFLLNLNKIKNNNYVRSKLKLVLQTNESAEYIFSAFGHDFHLELSKNTRLFAPDYKEYTLDVATGNFQEKLSSISPTQHCFYHGYVRGVEVSSVAVTTCYGGVQGLIQAHGKNLMIHPVSLTENFQSSANPDDDIDHHYIFAHSDLELPPADCGVSSKDTIDEHQHSHSLQNRIELPQPSSRRRLLQVSTEYVELLIVNDYARYSALSSNTETVSASIANYVDSYYHNSNFNPTARVVLTAQISFINGDPYPQPNAATNGISTSDLLQNKFMPWATKVYTYYPDLNNHDSHILLSGLKFEGNIVGLAPVGGMCITSQSGAIVQGLGFDAASAASTMAHEMGHTLSMQHDDQITPSCPSGYIMSSVSIYGSPATTFSSCSLSYYRNWVLTSNQHCLDNIPQKTWSPGVCGNGIIETNEQCDCGSNNNNPNGCCNCTSCLVNSGSGYQCSDQQDCCSNCMFIPASQNKLCRPSKNNDCDSPEYCGGNAGACPADVFAQPGGGCTDSFAKSGNCYNGDCHSWDARCLRASSSYSACPNRQYNASVAICQRQYCTTNPNANPYTCTPEPVNPPNQTMTFAEDGVTCGSGKQCLNGQCLDSSLLWTGLNPNKPSNLPDLPFGLDWETVLTYGSIGLLAFTALSCLYNCCCRRRRKQQSPMAQQQRQNNDVSLDAQQGAAAGGGGGQYYVAFNEPLMANQQEGVPNQGGGHRSSVSVSGWIQHFTSKGQPYWYNASTGESRWTDPHL